MRVMNEARDGGDIRAGSVLELRGLAEERDAVDDVHEDTPEGGLSQLRRVINLIGIMVPFCGIVLGMAYSWGWGFGWVELGLLLGMYLATGFGVTIGFHRLFAHKSFSTGPVMTTMLAALGSMAAEGSLFNWVSYHRRHHQHSDEEGDPHTPHGHGSGVGGVVRGFWNAHAGWLLNRSQAGPGGYVPDLRRSRLLRTMSGLFPLWVLLSLAIPTVLGGVITLSWSGAFLGLLWGGLVRIALVHHVTWSVNSVCHLWGTRAFRSRDHSRNNAIVGVLALGEGWHNNHHAFPTSARHGLRWWEIDLSWIVIRALERVGLVWNVRLPAAERVEAKRR
jgi:stearoyl-CoA desaturase (delta-9 desaturase)